MNYLATHSLDVEFAEFLAAHGTSSHNREQSVFEITMSPVLTFDFGG